MNPLVPAGVVLLTTAFGRYRVAFIPRAECPLPGFRACAVQAVRLDPAGRPQRAVRLTLYTRLAPTGPNSPTGPHGRDDRDGHGRPGGPDRRWDDAA